MGMGIGVVVTSSLLYAKERNIRLAMDKRLLSIGLFLLILITGHLGGSLTHGSDYLTDPLTRIIYSDSTGIATIKPVPNVQEAVVKADENAMKQLRQKGVLVLPIAGNSNYLMANFVTDTVIDKEDLQLLLSLKKQLVWLKMGFTNVSNEQMAVVGQLTNLTRLSLEHTSVSDDGLKQVQSIQNLHYLNLVDTKVTKSGVLQLSGLKSLHSLFLYQTNISPADQATLKEAFPKTQIDIGGHNLPAVGKPKKILEARRFTGGGSRVVGVVFVVYVHVDGF